MNIDEYDPLEKDKTSSIEVSKTSTGKFSFKVKLYFGLNEDENSILERIKQIYIKLESGHKNENKP